MPPRNVAKPRQGHRTARPKAILVVAGSDSSGGAGIQADLRVIAAYGLHGVSAITAVTAQTARGVRAIHRVSGAALQAQLEAATEDFAIAAIKIGMLGSSAAIGTLTRFLRTQRAPIVLDPVLISSSGTALLPRAALRLLRGELIPLATVLTPNLPEAAALLGQPVAANESAALARELLGLGCASVLLKGGHGHSDPLCDYLAEAGGVTRFRHRRLPIRARGTGCALATAIAAGLAGGVDVAAAVRGAERYLQRALRHAYRGPAGTHLLASA